MGTVCRARGQWWGGGALPVLTAPSAAGGVGAAEPGQRGHQPGRATAGCECTPHPLWLLLGAGPASPCWAQATRHEGLGPHTCSRTPICPFARRPGPPTGGPCRSLRGSSTRRAPTWGAASRRPGPTMRPGGWPRRYGWAAVCQEARLALRLPVKLSPRPWLMSLFYLLTPPLLHPLLPSLLFIQITWLH